MNNTSAYFIIWYILLMSSVMIYTIEVNIVIVFSVSVLLKVSQIVCPLNIALLTRIAK